MVLIMPDKRYTVSMTIMLGILFTPFVHTFSSTPGATSAERILSWIVSGEIGIYMGFVGALVLYLMFVACRLAFAALWQVCHQRKIK